MSCYIVPPPSPPVCICLTVRARESSCSPLTSFPVWDDRGSEMAPHPVRDVDMERKEELILAKQLRAARVTILSRVGWRPDQARIIFIDIFSLRSPPTYKLSNLSGKKLLLLLLRLRSRIPNPLPEPRTPWHCVTGTSAAVRLSNLSSAFLNPLNL